MKKVLILSVFIVLFTLLASCQSGPTLHLYNWGEYIDDDLVSYLKKPMKSESNRSHLIPMKLQLHKLKVEINTILSYPVTMRLSN